MRKEVKESWINTEDWWMVISCVTDTKWEEIHWVHLAQYTWSDNKVRELIAVKVLHTSLLKTTVVAFKALPLGSYTPMLAPSPPFKTVL
jgi:hypothetical protein